MPASPTDMDIEIYLKMRLNGGIDPDAMGDGLRADRSGGDRGNVGRMSDTFLIQVPCMGH